MHIPAIESLLVTAFAALKDQPAAIDAPAGEGAYFELEVERGDAAAALTLASPDDERTAGPADDAGGGESGDDGAEAADPVPEPPAAPALSAALLALPLSPPPPGLPHLTVTGASPEGGASPGPSDDPSSGASAVPGAEPAMADALSHAPDQSAPTLPADPIRALSTQPFAKLAEADDRGQPASPEPVVVGSGPATQGLPAPQPVVASVGNEALLVSWPVLTSQSSGPDGQSSPLPRSADPSPWPRHGAAQGQGTRAPTVEPIPAPREGGAPHAAAVPRAHERKVARAVEGETETAANGPAIAAKPAPDPAPDATPAVAAPAKDGPDPAGKVQADLSAEIVLHVPRERRGEVHGPAPAPAPHAQVEPRHVIGQIAERVTDRKQNQIEITLTPEELGKVRLVITPGDTPLVTVHAENRETLDLMRRNGELLARELRETGLGGATISFGDGGADGSGMGRPERPRFGQGGIPAAEMEETPTRAAHRPVSGRQIDIRI